MGVRYVRVFIQSYKNGIPHSHNFYVAFAGFREMGFEIIPFSDYHTLATSRPEDIVVGYVGTVRQRLKDLHVVVAEMDYPEELNKYLGRRVWKDTINHISSNPELWPVFVKSIANKKFTGVVVKSPGDLIGCGDEKEDTPVLCNEPVKFLAEWRCFVRYGRILDIRRYKGNWKNIPDYRVMEQAVSDYATAPKGYAIDFGYTEDHRTLLIEVNDGYALGSYGLFYLDYAKLLSARWSELTQTEDPCNF